MLKVLLTILVLMLATPVVVLAGIALGPAILVLLFIGGIALTAITLGWRVGRSESRQSRRRREPSLRG